VATGSHRLVAALADRADVELSSSVMRKHLKSEHRWFAELMSSTRDFDRSERFMAAPTIVNGVPVQVEEMTGEPGDVLVMHPAALHTLAPNVLDEPRLALAQSVYPKAYFA
jgi:ectoine hydroxylase-related dioxygenase (phytanoyl-CoA dioxygenase family)